MTGIERLRQLSEDVGYKSLWSLLLSGSEDNWDCEEYDGKTLDATLTAIADQIEREHAEDCFRMGEHAADVSMSAYDLLPQEDREAIAWVREHGGLEAVRRMFQDADSRRVELCAALGIDLDKGWSEAMAAMRLRLMPEGYEWPRYEGGPLLRYGDSYIGNDGDNHRAWQIRFDSNADVHVSRSGDGDGFDRTIWDHFNKGERVRRPAVLASDGEPLEVGQTVYATHYGYVKCTVLAIKWDVDDYLVEVENEGGCKFRQTPDEFTHRRPVLDADGVPIHEGDTVWCIGGGEPAEVAYTITADASHPDEVVLKGYEDDWPVNADKLTHTKPEPPDSWELVEEDARGLDSGVDIGLFSHTHEDIVRRCKALAERGE